MIRARYHDEDCFLVQVMVYDGLHYRCVIARGERWDPNTRRHTGDLKLMIVSLDDVRLPRSAIPLMTGVGPDAAKVSPTSKE
jgi:hypothetical protein